MDARDFQRWLARNIGGHVVPSRERVNDAALAAIALGGEVVEDKHRSEKVDYTDDPPALTGLRKKPIGRNWTCSCGASGTVIDLPPGASPLTPECDYGSVRPKGSLRVCVRCDLAHLMPRLSGV